MHMRQAQCDQAKWNKVIEEDKIWLDGPDGFGSMGHLHLGLNFSLIDDGLRGRLHLGLYLCIFGLS